MEAYIGKCLDSLLIPEFDAVEVLVVNDGSKDRSSEIAHSYADRYPGSIRVIDKPNGNYGSCINAALPLATGRYVKVLDADDTFDTAAFSRFVRLLPTLDADAIITSYKSVDEAGKTIKSTTLQSWEVQFGVSYATDDIWDVINCHVIQMHMISYRLDLFNKFYYKQTEGISYTDTEWAIIPLCHCNTICFLNELIYLYLKGREGQTMQLSAMKKQFGSLLKVMASLSNYYISCKGSDVSIERLADKIIDRHCGVYSIGLRMESQSINHLIKEHDSFLKKNANDIFNGIGNKVYIKGLSYRHFARMRLKDYPVRMKLPIIVRFQILLLRIFKNLK